MRKLFGLLMAVIMLAGMIAIPALADAEIDPAATIYISTVADPVNCDPAFASDGESGMVVDRVFSSLMRYNPDGSVYPEIAESFEVSEDGLVYTFKIREGNKFHDGTVCDATAVKWNFDRQIGENGTADMPYKDSFFSQIVSCEAPDANTIILTIKEPNSAFVVYLAQRVGMGIISPTAYQSNPEGFSRNPVGSGPYKFGEWVSDQYFTLIANEDYILGKPENGQVVFKIIKESATRTSEMLTGGLDLMGNIAIDDIAALDAAENITLIRNPGKNIGYLAFADYATNDLFKDERLRKAVAYALDIETIDKGLYGDNMVVPKSVIPPIMQGGDHEFTTIGYDPEKAKELMTEAGYPDGFKFTLLAYNVTKGYNPAAERLAVQIQAELAKVNIRVDVIIKPWADFLASMYAEVPEHDAVVAGWGAASNDTSYMLELLDSKNAGTGTNHSGYNSPEFDALVAKAKAATSYEEAADLYAQAAQLANDDLPMILLGHGVEYAASSKKIVNSNEWYGRWGIQEDHMQKTK